MKKQISRLTMSQPLKTEEESTYIWGYVWTAMQSSDQ